MPGVLDAINKDNGPGRGAQEPRGHLVRADGENQVGGRHN